MIPKVLGSYGAPYADAEPIEAPTTQVASRLYNLAMDDLAQTTNSRARACVASQSDPAALAGDPIAVVDATSVWGDSVSANPTITKLGEGSYQIEWAASYVDGLGNTEAVALRFPQVQLCGGGIPYGFSRAEVTAANVITVTFGDLGGFDTDLGGKLISVAVR